MLNSQPYPFHDTEFDLMLLDQGRMTSGTHCGHYCCVYKAVTRQLCDICAVPPNHTLSSALLFDNRVLGAQGLELKFQRQLILPREILLLRTDRSVTLPSAWLIWIRNTHDALRGVFRRTRVRSAKDGRIRCVECFHLEL